MIKSHHFELLNLLFSYFQKEIPATQIYILTNCVSPVR